MVKLSVLTVKSFILLPFPFKIIYTVYRKNTQVPLLYEVLSSLVELYVYEIQTAFIMLFVRKDTFLNSSRL